MTVMIKYLFSPPPPQSSSSLPPPLQTYYKLEGITVSFIHSLFLLLLLLTLRRWRKEEEGEEGFQSEERERRAFPVSPPRESWEGGGWGGTLFTLDFPPPIWLRYAYRMSNQARSQAALTFHRCKRKPRFFPFFTHPVRRKKKSRLRVSVAILTWGEGG